MFVGAFRFTWVKWKAEQFVKEKKDNCEPLQINHVISIVTVVDGYEKRDFILEKQIPHEIL